MAAFSSSPAFLAHQLPKPRLSLSCRTLASNHSTARPSAAATPQHTAETAAVSTADLGASRLTRRFSLATSLALVALPAIGVVSHSQQANTSLGVGATTREANTKGVSVKEEVVEVVLPNGIRYYDLKLGGGASPQPGDLVMMNLRGRVQGSSSSSSSGRQDEELVNTFGEKRRPLALIMNSGRPYARGMCQGVEQALASMKAGGKRRVVVPPTLGFGDKGADLGSGLRVPPGATLEFIVQLDNISAPSC